jgi:hypothetical protein
MKTLHKEDKNVIINFIDNVRLRRSENVKLEISARYVAIFLKINPDQSNSKLANKFSSLLEAGKIA